jgi:hypothetical protein
MEAFNDNSTLEEEKSSESNIFGTRENSGL